MFAEDVDLLPGKMFGRMLDGAKRRRTISRRDGPSLFAAMAPDGRFGFERVHWFNGGLFDDDAVLPLTASRAVRDGGGALDWAAIDPSIFGTLFERGLDPGKRQWSQLDAPEPTAAIRRCCSRTRPQTGASASTTPTATIMMIIEPVVIAPLRREWERVKAEIRQADEKRCAGAHAGREAPGS